MPDDLDDPAAGVPCDRITELIEAGFPVEELTGAQQQLLAGLSDQEIQLLISIRRRLDELEPEVQAHTMVAGAGLF